MSPSSSQPVIPAFDRFDPAVRGWFLSAFPGGPTPVQRRAWDAIDRGENALVIAPTGSGKTFAAFLDALNTLTVSRTQPDAASRETPSASPAPGAHGRHGRHARRRTPHGVRILYISPLKALGADIERNLRMPLEGIQARLSGHPDEDPRLVRLSGEATAPTITVGMRTGDTTARERARLVRTPPDILITTPESLYLMLTSKAARTLTSVRTVIVDELHSLAGTKRGTHLALSLERLDDLLDSPAQRIGLSATIKPVSLAARFLGGTHPVTVVEQPGNEDPLKVRVVVPVPDMTSIPDSGSNSQGYSGPGNASDRNPGPGTQTGGTATYRSFRAGGPDLSTKAIRRSLAREQTITQDSVTKAPTAQTASAQAPATGPGGGSIWPYLENAILDQVLAHRTTIVFVNSRGLCEKLTARLNELYARRVREGDPKALENEREQGRDASSPEENANERLAGRADVNGDGTDGEEPEHYLSDAMGTSSRIRTVPDPIAKAHHGSVSKARRLEVERELKAGELRCVVATASLELGIDMGSIDLVIQVGPTSVSSGLQRIGRANHRVGGRPQGLIYPRTRTEIIDSTVLAEGMERHDIEPFHLVSNALDVLAQQTVAAVCAAPGPLDHDRWLATVRRAAPYAHLPVRAFDSVLDMLDGSYASADMATFTPRIVWQRTPPAPSTDAATDDGGNAAARFLTEHPHGVLLERKGARYAAITSAGTIPDRGLYPVVLAQGDASGRKRVGELDEEMVNESRVGDVITLGTSSWRIREITPNRVVVAPALGRSARLPFWNGEGVGRPAATGIMRGRLLESLSRSLVQPDLRTADTDPGKPEPSLSPHFTPETEERLTRDGLNPNARTNLAALLAAQRRATGVVPTHEELLVEQDQADDGTWHILLHSPYGRRVNEPWAMAISQRVHETLGYDPQAVATDDGIVLIAPDGEGRLPDGRDMAFDPDELETFVRGNVDRTALFAARFRECAARALLMPSSAPGRRSPLWQQRLKGGELLEAARKWRDFPIIVEATRECLADVYDMPSLRVLMSRLEDGTCHLVTRRTDTPSPFAAPLLFDYSGALLYQGDQPHAERAASILSVDPAVLNELLGTADLSRILDPAACSRVEQRLQRLDSQSREKAAQALNASGDGITGGKEKGNGIDQDEAAAETVTGLLRHLGPLTGKEILQRVTPDGTDATDDSGTATALSAHLDALLSFLRSSGRILPVRIAGTDFWAQSQDARTLHEALGTPLPPSLAAEAERQPVRADADPLADLLLRFASTHGPFSTGQAARRFGVGTAVAERSLSALADAGQIVRGNFGTAGTEAASSGSRDAAANEAETVGSGKLAGQDGGERLVWVESHVLRRLRAASLAAARAAIRPVSLQDYSRFVLDRQSVRSIPLDASEKDDGQTQTDQTNQTAAGTEDGNPEAGLSELAAALAQFEGVALPARLWESSIFPDRVPGYRPAMLDALVSSGDVMWVGSTDDGTTHDASGTADGDDHGKADVQSAGTRRHPAASTPDSALRIAFYPTDSPAAPRVDSAIEMDGPASPDVWSLAWRSMATADSFAPVRRYLTRSAHAAPHRRRVSSHRSLSGFGSLDFGTRAEVGYGSGLGNSGYRTRPGHARPMGAPQPSSSFESPALLAAMGAHWAAITPARPTDTERAVETVESVLDRYGLLSSSTLDLAGAPGGIGTYLPVLSRLEDDGTLLRGNFVDGLGPAQFAARTTIDALRSRKSDTRATRATGRHTLQVLAADDPASVWGSAAPWPEDLGAKPLAPSRRPDSTLVLCDGGPVLLASVNLRHILVAGPALSDRTLLLEAARALADRTQRQARAGGERGMRQALVIRTINDDSALVSPLSPVLAAAGFSQVPSGLRLYVNPF